MTSKQIGTNSGDRRSFLFCLRPFYRALVGMNGTPRPTSPLPLLLCSGYLSGQGHSDSPCCPRARTLSGSGRARRAGALHQLIPCIALPPLLPGLHPSPPRSTSVHLASRPGLLRRLLNATASPDTTESSAAAGKPGRAGAPGREGAAIRAARACFGLRGPADLASRGPWLWLGRGWK